MTDRELLELAAKAAGYEVIKWVSGRCGKYWATFLDTTQWNPLEDDGDALRLAVQLQISIEQLQDSGDGNGSYCLTGNCIFEYHGSNACAATCRAIVRAAAEIGKTMENK